MKDFETICRYSKMMIYCKKMTWETLSFRSQLIGRWCIGERIVLWQAVYLKHKITRLEPVGTRPAEYRKGGRGSQESYNALYLSFQQLALHHLSV